MIVTKNDKKVLNFINQFKVATTTTIVELFYSSLRYGQQRLKMLYDNKLLNRDRDHFTSQYYYYTKKPKQVRHSLLLADFYREINKLAKIEYFENEFTQFDGIRPDGFLAAELPGNRKEIYFIETEISNKPDTEKYEELFKSNAWEVIFPKFPKVVFVTDKKVDDSKYFDVIKVDEDLKNIRGLLS